MSESRSRSDPPPEPEQFDPLRFLELARELATNQSDEARLRTAISRTYYALFLTIRDWVGVSGRDRAHRQVLQELGRRNQQGVGTLLNDLRRLREIADYQLLPEDPDQRDWVANWQEAGRILGRLMPLLERAGAIVPKE